MNSRQLHPLALAGCIGALLVLLLALTVVAQEPSVPRIRERDACTVRPQSPPETDIGHVTTALERPTCTVQQEAKAPAVNLGEPGLSFRPAGEFGILEQPYIADAQHLYRPDGLHIDSHNLYVAEWWGFRMLKYRLSDGVNLMTIGTPGSPWHHEDFLSWPADVTVDSGGNIWVVMEHGVKEFDPAGNVIQSLPEEDLWEEGDANDRFSGPSGIGFDGAGRMYVSDKWNHRVQVYTFTAGIPVYSTTVGVTGAAGDDDAHFNQPGQIALDSSGRLYVADVVNFRVQRCTYTSGWNCSTFHGTGSEGQGVDELSWAYGLGVDASDNIYIADGGNGRVKKCDGAGNCAVFASGFRWPEDAAVDSGGNVYVSDWGDSTVRRFSSSGDDLGVFAGTSGVPYLSDDSHFNTPTGVAVDEAGNTYVSTQAGYRVLQLDSTGTAQWVVGEPGVWGTDNVHFGQSWTGPRNVDVGPAGNVYVADTPNHRIQIYNSTGHYVATLGEYGDGPYQLHGPDGVAVDESGYIYVADNDNQRIQIFNAGRVYQATLGETDVRGSDDAHFDDPKGVAVDSNGDVYVADAGNHRVQKCTVVGSGGVCTTFAGVTGEWGDDHGHLGAPRDIAVDGQGRVYVADEWNERIQVFDSSGAYLTTLGGEWGPEPGRFRGAAAVDVDRAGNVYVADQYNHRIQLFAPGVPGWRQLNINGFGYRAGNFGTLVPFAGQLYAGISNSDTGAQLWRQHPGAAWTVVFTDGLGNESNAAIDHGVVFEDQLYVGVLNSEEGGQIWRSTSGDLADWQMVASGGFTSTHNLRVIHLVEFKNHLYAATRNNTHGAELWRSSSGDSGTWQPVVTGGFGDPDHQTILTLAVFGGRLFAGTDNSQTGMRVWSSSTGDSGSWSPASDPGFGDEYNYSVTLEPFDGYLYAGTYNHWRSDNPGAELWRCQSCDGTDWQQVPIAKGLGDTETRAIRSLAVSDGWLFAITYNRKAGMGVWRSADGMEWEQIGTDGLGDSNNISPAWDNSATRFHGNLVIGTINRANGGEAWLMLRRVYLPLVVRNY